MLAELFGMAFDTRPAAAVLNDAFAVPGPGPRLVVTANLDHVLNLSHTPGFRAAYAGAALRTLDGMPVVWLARARGAKNVHRVTGHDLWHALLARTPSGPVFIVAPDAAAANGAERALTGRGWGPVQSVVPPFGFEQDAAYGAMLAEAIRGHGTAVLLMGVGAPKSEMWVHAQGPALGSPVALCIGEALAVGAGLIARAPAPMQRAGLEWLWRFGLSPQRLFMRYFVRSWRFPLLAWRNTDLSK